MNKLSKITEKGVFEILGALLKNHSIRNVALPIFDKKLKSHYMNMLVKKEYEAIINEKHQISMNMLRMYFKRLDEGLLSDSVQDALLNNFKNNILFNDSAPREKAREKGIEVPLFLVISPTHFCNLYCKGCYASSHSESHSHLDYRTFDRILSEKRDLWGSYFTVISGGEPFLWQSDGKDIFDIFEKHSDQFFLVYTNGTLLNKKNAKRLARLGNVTPAISVEGFKEETDARRGEGTHEIVLDTFENLREEGVPFGISITATKGNVDVISSDKFVDFYFDREKASYCWLFQYMPIGRGIDLDMVITPEQRVQLYKRTRRFQDKKGLVYIDFWNSGYLSNGCICSGRGGGYFYIDWNGDVMPCVFIPCSTTNIYDVYKSGGDLNTILRSQFLKDIREWQRDYGFNKRRDECGNLILPCPIRDHYKDFFEVVKKNNARPVGIEADSAIKSLDYYNGMIQYDNELDSIMKPVWKSDFIKTGTVSESGSSK